MNVNFKRGTLQLLGHRSLLPLFRCGRWPLGYDFAIFRWWFVLGQEVRWLYRQPRRRKPKAGEAAT